MSLRNTKLYWAGMDGAPGQANNRGQAEEFAESPEQQQKHREGMRRKSGVQPNLLKRQNHQSLSLKLLPPCSQAHETMEDIQTSQMALNFPREVPTREGGDDRT